MPKNVTVKSVTFTWNKKSLGEIDQKTREGIFDIASDISELAQQFAPYVTGALRNSIRPEPSPDDTGIWVIAGGAMSTGTNPINGRRIERFVDYAAKVEEKSSSPHYMQRAQEQVMSGNWVKKYFGDITKKGHK